MQEAIDGYYSDIQRNILTHVSEQARQTVHFFDQAAAHSNLSPENVFMDSNQTDGQLGLTARFPSHHGNGIKAHAI